MFSIRAEFEVNCAEFNTALVTQTTHLFLINRNNARQDYSGPEHTRGSKVIQK